MTGSADMLLPAYVAIDESPYSAPYRGDLWAGGHGLRDSLRADPGSAGRVHLTVLGFAEHGELFAGLLGRIQADVARLKAAGHRVQRPVVYVISAGPPADDLSWRAPHGRLTDRATMPAAPNIITYGFGAASAKALREMSSQPELAFVAPDGIGAGAAISALFSAISAGIAEAARALPRTAPPPTAPPPTGPAPSTPPGRRRGRLLAGAAACAVAIAVTAGAAVWHGATSASPAKPAGPVPAMETAPFAGALDALTADPEVHYRSSVAGLGTLDVKVTNFGELIGSVTDDGVTFQIMDVGGKLYVKTPASGLPGVTNKQEAAAFKDKWLTGGAVESALRSIPADFVPPAQLAVKLISALGSAPALKGVKKIDGVTVVGASTSLGVLYVSAAAPYRIVSLDTRALPGASPSAAASASPAASLAGSEVTAYTVSNDDGMSFPADPPADGIAGTDQQLEDSAGQLMTGSVDLDLKFNLVGSGSISCSAAGCSVSVTVTNSISADNPDVTITGATIEADLVATITIGGEPAPGCDSPGTLPLDAPGVLECDSPGAGAVYESVEAQKKAQAAAESSAEGGAEVPYEVDYEGEYMVSARAQVNGTALEQQLSAESKIEGKLQNSYQNLTSALQRALKRTPAEVRATLSPEQLAAGQNDPSLRARYVGTSIEKAVASDPAVAGDPDILHQGASQPGVPVADFKMYMGGKAITIDVTGPSATSISSHMARSYIQSGTQLLLYPAPTTGFLAEVFR